MNNNIEELTAKVKASGKNRTPEEATAGQYLEAIDRCHTIQVMIEELLWENPAVVSVKYNRM